MKTLAFILNFLIPVVVTGPFIWFSSNHSGNNKDVTILLFFSIVVAFIFDIFANHQQWINLLATVSGITITVIIRIIIDWQYDPTSHNLFPFEIVIYFIFSSIAALIGIAIGFIFKRLRKGN